MDCHDLTLQIKLCFYLLVYFTSYVFPFLSFSQSSLCISCIGFSLFTLVIVYLSLPHTVSSLKTQIVSFTHVSLIASGVFGTY